MKNRISLVKKTPKRSRKSPARPGWLWRWHHLASGFVVFCGLGMLLAAFQFGDHHAYQAHAALTDNVTGYLWADPVGWISLNDINSPSPGGGGGSYGVTVDLVTREMTGFAWSDNSGWICFGSSCAAHSDCNGTTPGGALAAYVNSGSGLLDVHGWAKVCNEGDKGWISLNCSDPGACGVFPYKVVYNSTTKTFNGVTSHSTPNTSSLAWNGASDGSGFGYVDFEYANLNSAAENPPESNCNDGMDNDMNGLADCEDPACKATATCAQVPGVKDYQGNWRCHNGIDDDGTGIDCASVNCKTDPSCQEVPTNSDFVHSGYSLSGLPMCADSIDNDHNGQIDCMDTKCAGFPACPAVGEPACVDSHGNPLGTFACCHNGIDDDGDGKIDCADTSCQTYEPTCTPAWLQAKFGNVYAQQGITGTATKPSTATYCLTSQGSITGFTSAAGCSEASSAPISLPTGATGYKGTLGSLDIPGILAGRYGKVVNYLPANGAPLNGLVYHLTGDVTLNATQFKNAVASTDRGNGLLIVEGNLTITGNTTYAAATGITALRQLASFGVIVKKDSRTDSGNITIQPGVTNLVGAYFAENTIHTGTNGGTDVALEVSGLFAAYNIDLQRNFHSADTPAENVIYDGRAVANPPPGMADVSKSLPASREGF